MSSSFLTPSSSSDGVDVEFDDSGTSGDGPGADAGLDEDINSEEEEEKQVESDDEDEDINYDDDDDDDDNDDDDDDEVKTLEEVETKGAAALVHSDEDDSEANLHSSSEEEEEEEEEESEEEEEEESEEEEEEEEEALEEEAGDEDPESEIIKRAESLLGSQIPTTTFGNEREESEGDDKGGKDEDNDLDLAERKRIQAIYEGKGRKFRKRRRVGRPKTFRENKVPEAAIMKQGEANMLYAAGEYEEAAKVLIEVVKLAPSMKDSYYTLGLVNEALGNHRKAVESMMIAARLSSKDHDLWYDLAVKCEEAQLDDKGIVCFTQAIRTCSEKRPELYLRRASMYANCGMVPKALKDIQTVEQLSAPNTDVKIFISSLYDKMGKYDKAIQILLDLKKGANQSTLPLKLALPLTHLYVKKECFADAMNIAEACLDRLKEEDPGNGAIIELKVNAGISALRIGDKKKAESYLGTIYEEMNLKSHAELFLSVADNFYTVGNVEAALKFYEKLVGIKDYDHIALYIKIAECQQSVNKVEEAAQNYRLILSRIKPSMLAYLEVSILLAELLQKLSDTKEESLALMDKLERDMRVFEFMGVDIHPREQKKICGLYIREAKLNLRHDRHERFVKLILPILHFGWNDSKSYFQSRSRRRQKLKEESKAGGKQQRKRSKNVKAPLVSEDDLFIYSIECCKWLMHMKEVEKVKELLACASSCFTGKTRTRRSARKNAFRFLWAILDAYEGDNEKAYSQMRTVCAGATNSNVLWNFFFQTARDSGMAHHSGRYIARLRQGNKSNKHLMLAFGHHNFLVGNHLVALREYFKLLQKSKCCQEEPLLMMCIALTYMQYALGTREDKKMMLILKSFSFMMEAYPSEAVELQYNVGRLYHQIGCLQYAVKCYTSCINSNDSSTTSIKRSAAHNLALIYNATGAHELAADTIRSHLTI